MTYDDTCALNDSNCICVCCFCRIIAFVMVNIILMVIIVVDDCHHTVSTSLFVFVSAVIIMYHQDTVTAVFDGSSLYGRISCIIIMIMIIIMNHSKHIHRSWHC